jgi:hypothetical protein
MGGFLNYPIEREKIAQEYEERSSERKARLIELDGMKEDEVRTEWRILLKLKRDHNKGTE